MTKHASGKYGRTIGQKERKAGWPAAATAWCYLCNDGHRWEDGCAAATGHPAFVRELAPERARDGVNAERRITGGTQAA